MKFPCLSGDSGPCQLLSGHSSYPPESWKGPTTLEIGTELLDRRFLNLSKERKDDRRNPNLPDEETPRLFACLDDSIDHCFFFFLISRELIAGFFLRERSLDEGMRRSCSRPAPGCETPGQASQRPKRSDIFQRPKRLDGQ